MTVLQRLGCLRGRHERSRGRAWNDGRTYRSWCKGCGKPMIRTARGWQIDADPERPDPPPAEASHTGD